MRKLNIANHHSLDIGNEKKYEISFVESIAKQLARTDIELEEMYNYGVTELENYKKIANPTTFEKFNVFHIRQSIITKFLLTKDFVSKLEELNSKLKLQEQKIKKQSDKLWKSLNKQTEQKAIDDFEFNVSLSVYSNDKNCNKKYLVEIGNPFYKENNFLLFSENLEKCFYNDNWNENLNPSIKFSFCYTMHCLIYHSKIELQDILLINEVSIDLNISHQFTLKIKKWKQ